MPTLPRYPYTLHTLDNGLRVVVSEDRLAPVVAVNVWYGVGSRHETAGHTGFAHLFEHLMFQGSTNVGRGEHFAAVNAAGGTLNGTTWCDRTNYFETVPSNHLATALWLEADRMGGLLPALDQPNLDNQRDVVKNEKRQSRDNQPYGSWLDLLHELGYPDGHPYHHSTIGSMADLDAASLDDAREFYETWYAPDNAVLSIVGDVDTADALELVQRYFGGIPAKGSFPEPPSTVVDPRMSAEVRRVVPDRVPVPRSFLGHRIAPFGSQEFDVAEVLATVLGVGRGSRLYRAMVLDSQLLTPDGDIASTWPFIGGAALLIVDLPAREGVDIAAVELAYSQQIELLAAGGPSDEEMERAQALITSGWLHHLSGVEARADTFGQFATLLGDPSLVDQALPRLLAVTAEQVKALAREVLVPDNRVVVQFEPVADPGSDAATSDGDAVAA